MILIEYDNIYLKTLIKVKLEHNNNKIISVEVKNLQSLHQLFYVYLGNDDLKSILQFFFQIEY